MRLKALMWSLAVGSVVAAGWVQQPAGGQELVDPRVLGLDIAPGLVVTEPGRRVVTTDEADQSVVAKVHVTVGDHHVVLLPDGQLVIRAAAAVAMTDEPFKPADKAQLAQQLITRKLPGFQARQTRHYVFIYDTSEPFVATTSRILESMFSGVMSYAQGQRLEAHEPECPLVVVMFRTKEQFRRYRPMPPDVVAYYNVLTNEVVLYEESTLARTRPQLAIGQTLATIAHEGAHQILHNIGIQQRLSVWPMWVSEGMAEYFAPTTLDSRMKWKGVGQVNDLRMLELEEYLKAQVGPPDGNMVRQTVMAARLTSTGYASAWALTHFLAKSQRREFHNLLRELTALGPLEGQHTVLPPGLVAENLVLFQQFFGDELGRLEQGMLNHLRSLPYQDPLADLPCYVALLTVSDGRRVRRDARPFHSEDLALRWVQEQLASLPPEQRQAAQIAIRQFPNRAAANQFARRWAGE